MPTLSIDGQSVLVPDGTTLLDAAAKLGIEIPTLCHLAGGDPPTSCFLCVVQVEGRPRLSPSCATAAEEGMVVTTDSPDIHAARKMALELLLSDHVGDCEAPCRSACPAGMDIQWMNDLLRRKRPMGEAYAVVVRRIPLPATIGRICPRFCERACRRGRLDSAIAIGDLHRIVGEAALADEGGAAAESGADSGKRVAVLGAGPAGLSAAFHLRRFGHAVTVFEAAGEAGGGLRTGATEDRLLDAEIDRILAMGCPLCVATPLGKTLTLSILLKDFDAVVLAIGALAEDSQSPVREMLTAEGLTLTARGVRVDRATGATNVDGVFAAGDVAASTGRAAIRAIASGRTAAVGIDQFLRGAAVIGEQQPIHVRLGELADAEREVLFADVVQTDRSPDTAVEAARCLMCGCAKEVSCKLRRHATDFGARPRRFAGEHRELSRDVTHPEVVYESGKCIQCGICVRIAEREAEPLGLTFIGRGFVVRTAVPFSKPLAEALAKTARECAAACPTGALALKNELEIDRANDH